ncbi:uncharacterized protein FA14DRAFT_182223 [Meira miltonrushii]|uniref:Uncharacterized protein n=1 Tax=Meira miltonrushii TaxID=1280837 RepID=A0A316V731_9BASI|nr:uncharacterized protein FA14DRAFT_182223 [Meira miltonrushii]PWN32311.1 hypothetical protein FA14DRAFT_182223 [Meira miltonrushii]
MIFSSSFSALILLSSMLIVGSSPIKPLDPVFIRRSEGAHSKSTSESHTSTSQSPHTSTLQSPPSSPRLRNIRVQTMPVAQTRARPQRQSNNNSSGLRSPVQRSSPLRSEHTLSPNSVLKGYSAFDHHIGN